VGEFFDSGRAISGLLAVGLTGAGLIWRRLSGGNQPGPSWYVRLARMGSAITKLQIAEGTLDSVKESLLLERQEGESLRKQLRTERAETDRLRAELTRITSSALTPSSDQSNAGSTARPGARTRKRRTT
jgi:hypothetical protein